METKWDWTETKTSVGHIKIKGNRKGGNLFIINRESESYRQDVWMSRSNERLKALKKLKRIGPKSKKIRKKRKKEKKERKKQTYFQRWWILWLSACLKRNWNGGNEAHFRMLSQQIRMLPPVAFATLYWSMLTLHTTFAVYQFGVIRRLVSLDLEAEPDLPGVRFPQAAHTQGWSCSINAGPDGANTHCIHTTEGWAYQTD